MTDWKAVAKARGVEIPDEEMERVTGPLESLERVFRPLAGNLPASLEPEPSVRLDEDAA